MMPFIQAYGAQITAFAASAAVIWKVYIWFSNIAEGIKCQLRTDMLSVYYTNKDSKKIRQYELQNFEKNYAAYTALHGNSFIKDIRNKVITWEVIS